MSDADADGRVDGVIATFSEPLAPSSSTTAWTLTNVPSGGRLRSVSVRDDQAVLVITEGAAAPDTAVGAFTVALAATGDGIQSRSGERASFPATAPQDGAAPVPVSVTSKNVGPKAGKIEAGDELSLSFSEPLAPTSFPSTTTVSEVDPDDAGNDLLDIVDVTAGPLDTGSDGYIVLNDRERTAAFAGSPLTLGDDGRTLTVVVGPSCTACGGRHAAAGPLVFRPASTLTDRAGNGARGSFTTPPDFQLF